MKEAVLKLITLSGKHQGMDASPQAHHLPVAMETNSKGNYGKAVALVRLCPYVSLYKVSVCVYVLCRLNMLIWMWKSVCVCTFLCLFTFVVGGVIDCEISIPDDGQLHG